MKNIDFKEVVSSHEMDWKQQAEALAQAGTPFVLFGFSYPHHVEFYNQLALRFDLQSRFDPNKERAYFWKEKKQ